MEDNFPIRTLTAGEFPELLREIPDPPRILYVRGNLVLEGHKVITIVGSREHTVYGRQAVETLIRGLGGYPISIVSGLAIGIDTIVHKAALGAGLHTIAVPGSGLENSVLYPRRNQSLAREILRSGGALVSELPPLARAARWTFPARNRIMAGMAHATLIVEAGAKSGTLITARLAMEYNREVLAVPGSIFSEGSYGPQMLIKDGATPITKSEEIVEALGLSAQESAPASAFTGTEPELKILALLAQPMQRDALIARSGMGAHETNITLSLLELKGAIREDNGIIVRL